MEEQTIASVSVGTALTDVTRAPFVLTAAGLAEQVFESPPFAIRAEDSVRCRGRLCHPHHH